MCYMSESDGRPARVGVRELRQNLSKYLERVKDGEEAFTRNREDTVAAVDFELIDEDSPACPGAGACCHGACGR